MYYEEEQQAEAMRRSTISMADMYGRESNVNFAYNNNDDGMGGMGGQWGQSPGMNPMAGGMAGAGSTHNPMMYTGSGKEQEEQYDEDYIGASEAGSQANSGKSVDSNTPGRSVNNARGPMSRIDQLNNAEDTLNEEGM